ncbi:hypothetical protein D3C81_2167490 [compost metagenome]
MHVPRVIGFAHLFHGRHEAIPHPASKSLLLLFSGADCGTCHFMLGRRASLFTSVRARASLGGTTLWVRSRSPMDATTRYMENSSV